MISPSNYTEAIRYTELGYKVFPCESNGKKPLTPYGFLDASNNPQEIERWWNIWPDANIGIPTEGLIVIDIDNIHCEWPGSDKKHFDLIQGCQSSTPSGGGHYIFKRPLDVDWRNTVSKLAPKVDTRTDGGYIIVPPSSINNNFYKWIYDSELISKDELSLPPDWLISMLNNGENPSEKKTSVPEEGSIPEGMRNDYMTRIAGTMRHVGLGEQEILVTLKEINKNRCIPSLPDDELVQIARSICRYEPDQTAVAVIEDHYTQDFGEKPEEPSETSSILKYKDPGPILETWFNIPGFVSEVMNFCLDTAPYPNTALAFAGALSLQAHLGGRVVCDTSDIRTNLYVLALAYSASGKDWPRKLNAKILFETGSISNLGDRFASAEGLEDALVSNPNMLFQLDEMDGLLMQAARTNDGTGTSIINFLLTLFSSANGFIHSRVKTGRKRFHIVQPNLTIMGTAIPNHYYESMSTKLITKGLLSRMLIIDSPTRSEGRSPEIKPVPESILEQVRYWLPGEEDGNLRTINPNLKVIPSAKGVPELRTEIRVTFDATYKEVERTKDPIGTTIWGRANEMSLKLALIYAISENYKDPVISIEGTKWASEFMNHQVKRMLYMVQTFVSETPFHAECLKFIRMLKEQPERTMPHWLAYRKMRGMNKKEFLTMIESLAQQNEIEIITNNPSGSGAPGRYYKSI